MVRLSAAGPGYFTDASCDLAEFASLCSRRTHAGDVPCATGIESGVPVYDVDGLADDLADTAARRALMAEWARVLRDGAGVLLLRGAVADLASVDAATAAYEAIIAREKAAGGGGADHFAAAGANDRIWNSLQKLCDHDPAVFARYFALPAVDAICEAWLGPAYQMTAQVNLVRPGGRAQQAHRDYHLGFQTAEGCARFPAHVHELSPLMTLQGGIAHCDMPVVSGTTKLLPFSQAYRPGYAAYRRDDFRGYFEDHCVQLPLAKGDAIFFSPALFHAAGSNDSADVNRMVNLLQVSSAFGRAMESIDRTGMARRVYPVLAAGGFSAAERDAVIAATAEGYPFPTNLDTDPPVGGLAPQSQQDLMRTALDERWSVADFDAALGARDRARLA